jgi:hypothetical protein
MSHLQSSLSNISRTARVTPKFIVDETNLLSILHVLAACTPEMLNDEDSVSLDIIQTAVEFFTEPEHINYKHSILGTALCQATLARNNMVIDELNLRGADRSICARPEFFPYDLLASSKLASTQNKGDPLWLGIGCFQGFIDSFMSISLPHWGDLNCLQNIRHEFTNIIAKLLLGSSDDEASEEYDRLNSQCTDLVNLFLSKMLDLTTVEMGCLVADLAIEQEPEMEVTDPRVRDDFFDLIKVMQSMRLREQYGKLSPLEMAVIREEDASSETRSKTAETA